MEDTAGATVTMTVRAFKVMRPDEVERPMDLPTSFIDEECGYVDVYLADDQQMTFVHTKDVENTLKKINLHVFRSVRVQLKCDGDDDEKISMGANMRTDHLNYTVKPVGGSLASFKWPRFLGVKTKKGGFLFHVPYSLGGKGSEKICSRKRGCKRLLKECVCDTESEASSSHNDTGPTHPSAERKRRATDARAAFVAKNARKGQVPCPHFINEDGLGMCVRGHRCGMMHEGDEASWASIKCGLPLKKSGFCDAHPNCIYNHDA